MFMLKTITPIDNSVYVERNYASPEDIENTLNLSKKVFQNWKRTSLDERKKTVSIFVDNFLKNNQEIEEELCKQMGRPISQCNGEMKGFKERALYMIEKSKDALENIISRKDNEFDNFIEKFVLKSTPTQINMFWGILIPQERHEFIDKIFNEFLQ